MKISNNQSLKQVIVMSKLTENLSDAILSRWDKKRINDKGEKIVTSLLTRFALNKGTYLSNEL